MGKKIDPEIKRMLVASGEPWELRGGAKHQKICVRGMVVLVVPFVFKEKDARQCKNARAVIKKHLEGLKP